MIDYGIVVDDGIICKKDTLYIEMLAVGENITKAGIVIPTEKMDAFGHFVKPRWAKVIFKADNLTDFEVGDWVLIQHGKWSSSIKALINGVEKTIWYVSDKSVKEQSIIAVSKKMPTEIKGFYE
jgi:hypothetical protein